MNNNKLPMKHYTQFHNRPYHLAKIDEEDAKLNSDEYSSQRHFNVTCSQSPRSKLRQRINKSLIQLKEKHQLKMSLSSCSIKHKPKLLIKPKASSIPSNQIDLFHITPGKIGRKKAPLPSLSSSTIYFPSIQEKINCMISLYSHDHLSNILQYKKYCIPTTKTNFNKRHEIIPGLNKAGRTNSMSMMTNSTNNSMDSSIGSKKPLCFKKIRLKTSKSEMGFNNVIYKLKIK